MKITALIKNLCAHQKIRRPNSASAYYLGSAESPTADFLQVRLKSSRSGDVASRACSPQVTWRLSPPSLYGRRLSRTVPAVVPARLAKISALCPNICACLYFHHFLGKSQKSISASNCPITAPKIRTWSQKLSKFSCNTFEPLNGGRPRSWPRSPDAAGLPYHIYRRRVWEGEGREGREQIRPCTKCSLHACSFILCLSFSYLRSAVEASFNIKKACRKPFSDNKILTSATYWLLQNIGDDKISTLTKYRRWQISMAKFCQRQYFVVSVETAQLIVV
jgi:hypothetical protein